VPTLLSIVIAALAGGVLSTLAAAATLRLASSWIPRLVSFAVGALLGAVFLELLPHALESGGVHYVMLIVLIGLLAFFLLEKLVLWRHAHGHEQHANDDDESEHDHAMHGHANDTGCASAALEPKKSEGKRMHAHWAARMEGQSEPSACVGVGTVACRHQCCDQPSGSYLKES